MKTLIFKSIVILVIIVSTSYYLYYLNTGKPLIDEIPSIDISTIVKSTRIIDYAVKQSPTNKNSVYKWIDENGKTHYSSEALNDKNATEVAIDISPNFVREFEAKAMHDAKEVQTLVDERDKKIE